MSAKGTSPPAKSSLVSGILIASFDIPSVLWASAEPGVNITHRRTEYKVVEGLPSYTYQRLDRLSGIGSITEPEDFNTAIDLMLADLWHCEMTSVTMNP